MSAVVSLSVQAADRRRGDLLVREVARMLGTQAVRGLDGTWELAFAEVYPEAYASVTRALASAHPEWQAVVTVEYALTA